MRAPIPEPVCAIMDRLTKTVDQEGLPRALRLKVAAGVRHAIVPASVPRESAARRHAAWTTRTPTTGLVCAGLSCSGTIFRGMTNSANGVDHTNNGSF